ncbi:hypothetical protein TNCV_813881 [Trichonephila clavipes]|nr:hypothetical protein TNCV_813881 [Trichonephila clavipes]
MTSLKRGEGEANPSRKKLNTRQEAERSTSATLAPSCWFRGVLVLHYRWPPHLDMPPPRDVTLHPIGYLSVGGAKL